VAAGTSNSTLYYSKYSAGFVEEDRWDIAYLNLLQLQIPQLVHRECLKSGMEEGNGMQPLEDWDSRLIKRPVKEQAIGIPVAVKYQEVFNTHLNSMTSVPTKLATLMPENAIENSNTTLAVVRLKSTRVRMNFQNAATVGTSPTRSYTIPLASVVGQAAKAECRTEPVKEQKVEIQKRPSISSAINQGPFVA
jgi:hypothetical protein